MVYTGEVISFKDSTEYNSLAAQIIYLQDGRYSEYGENIDDFLKIVSYLSSVNVTVSEEVQAILLLNSLPSRFNSLKKTFKYNKDTLSLEEVTSAARSKIRISRHLRLHMIMVKDIMLEE